MVYAATWCPICENQVSEKYKDTEKLLCHIRTCHPPVANAKQTDVKRKSCFHDLKKTSKRLNPFKKSSQSSKKVREVILSESRENVRVEKIVCPFCNVESLPLLFEKRSRKFIANCRLGAICLLGCWPLCFVPLMISHDKRVRMVCPLCGYDYGTYDVRNAKDTTVIVDTAETLLGTTKILPITSTTRIRQHNENTLPVDTRDESTIIEKSISEEFDDNRSANAKKHQREGAIYRQNKCDGSVECVNDEKKSKDATILPIESFDYSAQRVDEKNRSMGMETSKFSFADIDSDSVSSFQRKRMPLVLEEPISKCCDDEKYSSFRKQRAIDRNPTSPVCQHNRCQYKNLKHCCGTNENTKGTRDRIICFHDENVSEDQSYVRRDNRTNEHSSPFANNTNFYDDECYPQDDW